MSPPKATIRKDRRKSRKSNRIKKDELALIDSRPRRNPNLEVKPRIGFPAHQEEDEDRFYVIEKLLDKRENKGKEEYLVRWLNYGPDWDSWEPREELERNALDMVKEYDRIADSQLTSHFSTYCVCKKPYRFEDAMIQCFHCKDWYHFKCINMNMEEANSYLVFYCHLCREENPQLKCCFKANRFRIPKTTID